MEKNPSKLKKFSIEGGGWISTQSPPPPGYAAPLLYVNFLIIQIEQFNTKIFSFYSSKQNWTARQKINPQPPKISFSKNYSQKSIKKILWNWNEKNFLPLTVIAPSKSQARSIIVFSVYIEWWKEEKKFKASLITISIHVFIDNWSLIYSLTLFLYFL